MKGNGPSMGMNKTGTSVAPRLSKAMQAGMEEFPPSSEGDDTLLAAERVTYAIEGEPAGSVPPPPSLKNLAKAAIQKVQGTHPVVLTDKLGERLAFERRGVRVYQTILSKFDAYGGFEGGPNREALEQICEDELAHFQMLRLVIEEMGGDPTAVTPSANFHAVATLGVVNAVADPRTDFVQALEAALMLELADNDCWESLIELAEAAGEPTAAERFRTALEDERLHLTNVRTWLAAAQDRPVAAGLPRTVSRSSENAGTQRRSGSTGSTAQSRTRTAAPPRRAKTGTGKTRRQAH